VTEFLSELGQNRTGRLHSRKTVIHRGIINYARNGAICIHVPVRAFKQQRDPNPAGGTTRKKGEIPNGDTRGTRRGESREGVADYETKALSRRVRE
jgi:hypothetical protein